MRTPLFPLLGGGSVPSSLPPSGAAGGDLAGTYPNPTIAANAVTTTKVADANITLPKVAAQAANTIVANATAGSASPTAVASTVNPSTIGTNAAGALSYYSDGQGTWGKSLPSNGSRKTTVYASDHSNIWIANAMNEGGFIQSTTGTAAAISNEVLTDANRIGVLQIYSGTTNTGRAAVYISNNYCLFGGGVHSFRDDVKINQLSNGTDTYTAWLGYADNGGVSTVPANGAFFRYTDSVNGGKWQCVTRDNGSETATDSGVAAQSSTYSVFEIQVNATGTSVSFWIDGVLVATNTTNIPTAAGRTCGPMAAKILNSAGTGTGRYFDVDWTSARFDRTTPL